MNKTAAPGLVEIFQSADETQLAAIDATIVELNTKIADVQKTIDGLAAIRKALSVKLHGKPPRKQSSPKPATKPAPTAGNSASLPPGERIVLAIRQRGPLSRSQLVDLLGISPQGLAVCIAKTRALDERGGLVRIVDDED